MDQFKTGRFIAENRKQMNMTQEMLGEALGVTNKTVSRWETGKYMPDLDTIPVLTGVGTGAIIGVVYAPDNPQKAVCVAAGLTLLCVGWYLRSVVDRTVIGR